MSEEFTAWGLEVLISGAWVDLTVDVLADPALKCSRGISGSDVLDRVADPGELTFSLDNSQYNSAALIGRYTPGHTNCLTGWTSSLPVRLWFSYDSWTYVKWYGRIEPDGINVTTGTVGSRRVDVRCVDWFGIATDHVMDLPTTQANKWMYEAIDIMLAGMPIPPKRREYIDEPSLEPILGLTRLPTVFDITGAQTTALSEFQKLAQSQQMFIVVRGGQEGEILTTSTGYELTSPIGVVTAASQSILTEAGDDLLLENGDTALLDETTTCSLTGADILPDSGAVSFGKYIHNHVTEVIMPRKMDAAATTVLWTLEAATEILAGTFVTIRGAYRDPNGGASKCYGTSMVTPVANTDYKANTAEDGTGTDMTSYLTVEAQFGTPEVNLKLYNTHGSTTLYVGGATAGAFFQVRGKGVYIYDTVRTITRNDASIQTHGVHPLTYDYSYKDSYTVFNGANILARYADPFMHMDAVTMIANKDAANMTWFLFLEPRSRLVLSEEMSGISSGVYFMQGYSFSMVGKKIVQWTPVLAKYFE